MESLLDFALQERYKRVVELGDKVLLWYTGCINFGLALWINVELARTPQIT
jgi:hypothetical protein